LAGVHLVAGCAPLEMFPSTTRFGARVAALAEENGLIVRAIGDTIAICPPLVINEQEIGMLIDRLSLAIELAAAELV
jgi:4-aminobutyrate--pyruvate transaminase